MPIAQAASQQLIQGIIKNATTTIGQGIVAVFTIAVLVFGWGIVRLIAASSNAEEVRKAKGIIWWGLIGMFILASLGAIIAFFQKEIDPSLQTPVPIKPPQFQPK